MPINVEERRAATIRHIAEILLELQSFASEKKIGRAYEPFVKVRARLGLMGPRDVGEIEKALRRVLKERR